MISYAMKPPPDLRQIIAQMNRANIIVASRKKTATIIVKKTPRHLIEAVKALHFRSALEIHGLLRDSEDFCIDYSNDEESPSQKIDVEKMVQMLPKHLMAVHMSDDQEDRFEYILCGIRLIQTLCDLAPRHTKLDQVLLDDVVVAAEMLNLVFLVIISVAANRRERVNSDEESLIDATLVASSLYLMHGFISPLYSDLVQVLLAHPRGEVFIECAFEAVHNVVRSLKAKLLFRPIDASQSCWEMVYVASVNVHCQQAEAALQFLHSLCLHKSFRDRVAENKEISRNGGILMLAQTILSLAVTPEFVGASVPATIASISRMKAKALSILHQLFEADSISFLDEVANAGKSHLAKPIATEVLSLMRLGLSKAVKCRAAPEYPMGLVLLNAMRVADVFTDDSHFRSICTEYLSMVLSAVFCLSHGDFLSMLCSSNISSKEDDANVDYDLFASTGWVINFFSSQGELAPPQFKLNLQSNLTMSSYAHQRSSLVIKMISNLHCFSPKFCKEDERNQFLKKFVSGLRKDPSSILVNMLPSTSYTPEAQRGTGVSKNLCSLVHHAQSLIPIPVNEQDFMLLRVFYDQCQPLLLSEFKESQEQVKDIEAATKGVNRLEIGDGSKESDVDANNLETSGSDTSSNRGKNVVNRIEDGELVQSMSKRSKGSGSGEVKEDEKAETFLVFEKQRKKRKRSIMNDDQMRMIETALADEPDMQRNSASIQLWADKLSQIGSEVITSSQLKNWLNNRKAKLARAKASKQTGQVRDSNNNSSGDLPDSPVDENASQQKPLKDQTESRSPKTGENLLRSSSSSEEGLKRGQQVMLMDERGDEIGKGIVVRTDGEWYSFNLETKQVCVVDVVELSGLYDWSKMMIPYGSDDVGRTFEEANSRFGVMRVAWDVNKVQYHQTLLH